MKGKKQNKIIILSGVGGSGKTSISDSLCKDERFINPKTTTSREKRSGESEGSPYYFVNKSEFEKMINNEEFIEWVLFNGNYYGTNKKRILNALKQNNCVLVLDCVGAKRFKKMLPNDVITFFIYVDLKEIKRRLKLRGETLQNIKNRLEIGKTENLQRFDFDFIVENENGKLEECVNKIKEIVLKQI